MSNWVFAAIVALVVIGLVLLIVLVDHGDAINGTTDTILPLF